MKAFTFLKRQLKHTEEDIISQIDELDLDKPDMCSNLKILLDHTDVIIPYYKTMLEEFNEEELLTDSETAILDDESERIHQNVYGQISNRLFMLKYLPKQVDEQEQCQCGDECEYKRELERIRLFLTVLIKQIK